MSAYMPIPSAEPSAPPPPPPPPAPPSAAQSAHEDRIEPLPQYNPRSWRETLLVLEGRPFAHNNGERRPLYLVWAIGVGLVVLSALVGVTLEENDRKCRAWCSRFSLGPQPHSYIGVILFLLMAFRSNQAYHSYQAGLAAWTVIRRQIFAFATCLLNTLPRDAIPDPQRARMLAFAAAFPYALQADLLETRDFEPGTIDRLLSTADLERLRWSGSMPLHVVESLLTMTRLYESESGEPLSPAVQRVLNKSILSLIQPMTESERIKANPVAFAYVCHLRLLLIVYLGALPLALVESLGWSTIPVFMVISYALMSLEIIAVMIENPFGGESSDLRIGQFNQEIVYMLAGMWRRFEKKHDDQASVAAEEYSGGLFEKNETALAHPSSYKCW